jgi:glycosyltransferase involved in cell wall biosynthesis
VGTLKEATVQAAPRHLLHVFASFGLGGVPIRICDVINALEGDFRHTIVSLDRCFDARTRLSPHVAVEFREFVLSRYFLPSNLYRFGRLLRAASPDMLLTYNWGAVECGLTNRLLGQCQHVHFESGFGAEDARGPLWRRNFFRRLAIGGARNLVVPSQTLMRIAAEAWRVPASKLRYIPNGVDTRRYHGKSGIRENGMLLGVELDQVVVGIVAPLRPEKNVGRLLRAFAALPEYLSCVLVIAGDGAEMAELRELAAKLNIAARSHFLGHVEDVPLFLRQIDIFALSSDTEQMPNSLLQAMAAARPIAAVDVGDVRAIVGKENREFIVARDDEMALTGALEKLAVDPVLREMLGRTNQERIKAQYELDSMVAAYGALFDATE